MEGVIDQSDEIIAPSKTVISGKDKFARDIPLVTPKLHFDGISHFDLNVVPDIQNCVLASDNHYNATVLLVVSSTIVSFILALAGGFQWKLRHIAQPHVLQCSKSLCSCNLLLSHACVCSMFPLPNNLKIFL